VDKRIRTGVIGLGKMGIFHSALIKMIPQAELVAVHDVNPKLEKYVRNAGIDVDFYPDLGRMLDQEQIEAVLICTPPFTHLPIARKCEEYGLDMMVEKPLAESLASASEMVSLIREKANVHSTGFTAAHIPLLRKAKQMLDAEVIGRPVRFGVSVYISQVFGKKKGWFFDKRQSGGGVIIDIASHLIYLIVWYFGLPEMIQSRLVRFFSEVEDSGTVLMEYQNGLTGSLDTNWSLPGYRMATHEINIEGESGYLEITNEYIKLFLPRPQDDFDGGWTTLYRADIGSSSPFDLGSEGFYDEDKHFIDCCLTREKPRVTWEEGWQVQKVIQAIYRSDESRQPVSMGAVR